MLTTLGNKKTIMSLTCRNTQTRPPPVVGLIHDMQYPALLSTTSHDVLKIATNPRTQLDPCEMRLISGVTHLGLVTGYLASSFTSGTTLFLALLFFKCNIEWLVLMFFSIYVIILGSNTIKTKANISRASLSCVGRLWDPNLMGSSPGQVKPSINKFILVAP